MKNPKATKISRAIMAIFYIIAGCMHFIIPDFYIKIMPPYVPMHHEMVFVSGLAEIILGFGVMGRKSRRISAWGIIILLVAVFPANVHAYLNSDTMNTPEWLLLIRLPFQGVLIYWAYYFTHKEDHKHKKS
ncbi:MAG: DoxX-like family protein [Leptospiraceae bacterium]|nr:DoxX-like family protein [Leptospiraceae bacterium]